MRIVDELGKFKLVSDSRPDVCGLEIFTDDLVFYCLTAELHEEFKVLEFDGIELGERIICDAVINNNCLGVFDYDGFADEFVNKWSDGIETQAAEKCAINKNMLNDASRRRKFDNDFVNAGTSLFDEMLQNVKARVVISCCGEDEVGLAYLKYNNSTLDLFTRTDKGFRHDLVLGVTLPALAYDKLRNAVICGDLVEQMAILVKFKARNFEKLDLSFEKVQDEIISSSIFCERHNDFFRLVFPNWIMLPDVSYGFPGAVGCFVSDLRLVRNRINVKSAWHKEKYGSWDNPKRIDATNQDMLNVLNNLLSALDVGLEIKPPKSRLRKFFARFF